MKSFHIGFSLKTQRDLNSEFNSIHFGKEINKKKFLRPQEFFGSQNPNQKHKHKFSISEPSRIYIEFMKFEKI